MIHLERLESRLPELREQFRSARPFPHLVLDDFADADRLARAARAIPQPGVAGLNKSRDYIFAKNKFEKSNFRELSTELNEIYEELTSERFGRLLREITGEPVFVDAEFFGGGIHQGGEGSFLDMHADFNYHPVKRSWFRNLNVLLYLNEGWEPSWRGELKLRHAQTGELGTVQPLFNRCVIMLTREHTLHGYDPINFPPGRYRRSIATYAYAEHASAGTYRSTRWVPERASALKRFIGQRWPTLVRVKNALFGVGTRKNR